MIYGEPLLTKQVGWKSTGYKNKIQVSSETYSLIKENFDILEKRKLDIKGLGSTNTYIIK